MKKYLLLFITLMSAFRHRRIASGVIPAALVFTFMNGGSGAIAQTISGTGSVPPCINCAPTGWTIVSGTPDIGNMPIPSPPGTSDPYCPIMFGTGGILGVEAIGTTITGLTSGQAYNITIWVRFALGFTTPQARITVDGVNYDRTFPAIYDEWFPFTVPFTASGPTALVAFSPISMDASTNIAWAHVNSVSAFNPVSEVCGNSFDDDGDGLVDGADSDCSSGGGGSCTGTINLTTTNPASGASISYAYTNSAGVIQGVTSGASFTNVPEGAYNVYALQYETGSFPATWAVGQNVSATVPDACNQVSGPSPIQICCTPCNDPLLVMTRLTEPGCPSNMLATLRIKNGADVIPTGSKITFYDGDPTAAGAVKLGTYTTTADIAANAIENFPNINVGACTSANGWVYAVLGDDGNNTLPLNLTTGLNANGGYDECDFTDNMSGIKIKERCGKYANMVKR